MIKAKLIKAKNTIVQDMRENTEVWISSAAFGTMAVFAMYIGGRSAVQSTTKGARFGYNLGYDEGFRHSIDRMIHQVLNTGEDFVWDWRNGQVWAIGVKEVVEKTAEELVA